MAEFDLTPIEIEDTLQGTFDLLKKYFLRENNPFHVVTDFINEDGFTIDIVRPYSVIASTHKASIHLMGSPLENGNTKLALHAKSVDELPNLEKQVRDRIQTAMQHLVAEKKNTPLEEEDLEAAAAKDRRQLIIVAVVAALIILGAVPISCSEQFSRFWLF